jgi:hypothetical protein
MIRVDSFLDIHHQSLRKKGEELCGDTVRVLRTDSRTILVLSDGLGSGVKANILATLTAEILVKMIQEDVPLADVIETVVGTLPICKVRNIAYATFTAVRIDQDNSFQVINFDNPPPLYFRRRKLLPLAWRTERILDRPFHLAEGSLERGDVLAVASDGVLFAGMGKHLNFGWGWDQVARYLEQQQLLTSNVRQLVQRTLAETNRLYHGEPGDDATLLGLAVRNRNSTFIFTGPPLDPTQDEQYVQRLLSFNGRTIVCGGTTANIVSNYLGEPVRIDVKTLRPDVPPIGELSHVDLVTEGILTMSKALEYLRASGGDPSRLPADRNGARLLAEEILRADFLYILVGQRINEFYQNPLLPKNISIRRSLVEEIAAYIRGINKEVMLEYC